MFPFGGRDLPVVEQKILSYVGARDLVNAKLVCKTWRQGVKKYLHHLKTAQKGKEIKHMLRKLLLEPVNFFATINLWRPKRDLCANERGEVFVLSDECIVEFDLHKLHVAKELHFPSFISDRWDGIRGCRKLTACLDGHFEVHQECWSSASTRKQFRTCKSKLDYLEYVGGNQTPPLGLSGLYGIDTIYGRGKGYDDMYNGETAGSTTAMEIERFCKDEFSGSYFDFLCDVAWVEDMSAAVFSVSSTRSGMSKLYGIEAGGGGGPRLIAAIPMESANLLIVGTRVICHSGKEGNNWSNIIVLDVWNPESVRQEGVNVTRIM